MSTPPQGWGPQQQQQAGYGRQQQPPPPGYPYHQQGPPQPPAPPKKKRTGLVIGLVIAVVVLGVGGFFGKLYLDYTEDPGGGPGETPVAQCDISAALKSQAHVSSFRLAGKPDEDNAKGMWHSNCFWEQTKGKDGLDRRVLNIHVYDYSRMRDGEDGAKSEFAGNSTNPVPGDKAKGVEGLGDEAMFVAPGAKTDATEVDLVVRKGAVVYLIKYFGHDRGFFADSDFPVSDAEAVVRKAAEELIAR